ncbi:MAG TPA: metallophosphoesterase [bacterium]|nr:metallophosphoesterase [bacterium]
MLTIAVLADTHRSTAPLANRRRGEIAHVLLLRAVHRLNRSIRPDVTIIAGDILDAGQSSDADNLLSEMASILGLIESPKIVLPGNHDCSVEKFEQFLGLCPQWLDVANVRFVPFLDQQMSGYNACRSEADLERMAAARNGWPGELVTVQHVPLFPPGTHPCPYNYTNADAILQVMDKQGYSLSVSGHYHHGMELMCQEGVHFMAAPALCDSPFGFSVLRIENDGLSEQRHALRMPDNLRLFDCHVHTPFAYCNENMQFSTALELGEAFGLGGLAFCEHSGQLYFGADDFWSGRFAQKGILGADEADNRMSTYLQTALSRATPSEVGLEVDCDFRGNPVLKEQDRSSVSLLIGSIHKLSEFGKPNPDRAVACQEFLFMLERFLKSGIEVLAHPFRVFVRSKQEKPECLFEPTASLLRDNGVAAEINFHKNQPPHAFVEMCLNMRVKLALGSDSHNLYEVGEFAPHLEFLEQLGCLSQLESVLFRKQE